jgi:hypothetical protein
VVQLLGMFSSSDLKAAPFWKWLVCLEHQISLFLGWRVNCSSTSQYSFARIPRLHIIHELSVCCHSFHLLFQTELWSITCFATLQISVENC